MPRNFFRRIEVVFPIEDGNLRERITDELLGLTLADTVKARFLQPDGAYQRPQRKRGAPARESQAEFVAVALGDSKPGKAAAEPAGKYPKMTVRPRPPTRRTIS